MAKDKQLKREVRAIWDAIRDDRRSRLKLTTKDELAGSAALLRAHADSLSALADQSAVANDETAGGSKKAAKAKKGKAKRKGKGSRAKRAAKRKPKR